MTDKCAILVLEDGSCFKGKSFGSEGISFGEVVFNTSMTGYQEILTDPSYAGQIVIPTYPLIGNYGINKQHAESNNIQVSGFVVREHSSKPSHMLSSSTLEDFLHSQNIIGISGIDTRSVVRRLRSKGVMMGAVATDQDFEKVVKAVQNVPNYEKVDLVSTVKTTNTYQWQDGQQHLNDQSLTRIVVVDFGLKFNILRILYKLGCEVTVVPAHTSSQEILDLKPSGIVISPGPGNPDLLDYAVTNVKNLVGRLPVLGICLGNQIIGRAFGGRTYKLKFGHRGGNHPVRDLRTGLVHITSQNHGYTVDPDSLSSDVEVSHINLHDGTVEGLRHKSKKAMSIQYHSEGSPGPKDNEYIFNEFLDWIRD
tara:strand:- start:3736 stop:4833 length:1098 start_codon:yes stop_codon:yes gene_type:complete